jgi:hypothetical protein
MIGQKIAQVFQERYPNQEIWIGAMAGLSNLMHEWLPQDWYDELCFWFLPLLSKLPKFKTVPW